MARNGNGTNYNTTNELVKTETHNIGKINRRTLVPSSEVTYS